MTNYHQSDCNIHHLPIKSVCLFKQCNVPTRLQCEQCLKLLHSDHPQYSILVDNIQLKILDEQEQLASVRKALMDFMQQTQVIIQEIDGRLMRLLMDIKAVDSQSVDCLAEYFVRNFELVSGEIVRGVSYSKIQQQLSTLKAEIQQLGLQPLFQFSDVLKHQDMCILTPFHVIKKSYSSNALQLIIPQMLSNQVQTITFRINKIHSSVAVGLCDAKLIRKANYLIQDWSSLNHGCYILSCSGYSYNSAKSDQNYVKIGFKYNKGDCIKLIYNPSLKTCEFVKVGTDQSLQLSIESDELHPCIYLSRADESIEILQC